MDDHRLSPDSGLMKIFWRGEGCDNRHRDVMEDSSLMRSAQNHPKIEKNFPGVTANAKSLFSCHGKTAKKSSPVDFEKPYFFVGFSAGWHNQKTCLFDRIALLWDYQIKIVSTS